MIIKLFQPPTKNWLIVGAQLDDPPTWDRFVPCHTTESQRWQFECTVKEEAASNGVRLKPCKDLLTRGVSVFEYDWTTEEEQILGHAMQVADRLGIELAVGGTTESVHSAA
ncbi:MAG TPA: hypothetical protein V6C72_13755 [Chroococcales cyanobacterium]